MGTGRSAEPGEGMDPLGHRGPAPSMEISSSVSSPAMVPSTPGRPARSMAEPTTCAEPGGVRTMTRSPERVTSTTQSTEHAAQMVRWCHLLPRELRNRVGGLSARDPDLDGAQLLEVACDTVETLTSVPSAASNSTRCAWLVTWCSSSSRAIRCCRCALFGRDPTARAGPGVAAARLIEGPRPTARRAAHAWCACGCGPVARCDSVARRGPRRWPRRHGGRGGSAGRSHGTTPPT